MDTLGSGSSGIHVAKTGMTFAGQSLLKPLNLLSQTLQFLTQLLLITRSSGC
jgi:hypothetical protein